MAHFAQLDENNIVIQVVVVNDLDCRDSNNNENEEVGIHFLKNIFGSDTKWKQTSYNNNIRKRYAGIGFTYDEVNDVFINKKPFSSWSLNNNFDWEAPIPYPNDGNVYVWNEETTSWNLI